MRLLGMFDPRAKQLHARLDLGISLSFFSIKNSSVIEAAYLLTKKLFDTGKHSNANGKINVSFMLSHNYHGNMSSKTAAKTLPRSNLIGPSLGVNLVSHGSASV